MRTIVGVLSAVFVLANLLLLAAAPTPIVIAACLLITGCAGIVCFGFWRDTFAGLVTAALFSATMAGLASAALLELALRLWPALAWPAGVLVFLATLGWAARAWDRSKPVLAIELLILRDKNTLKLSPVRGPTRVLPLPFREIFARLPLLSQELVYEVEQVDVIPRSGAIGRQIDTIAVETTFHLEADQALHIFTAPSWRAWVAQALRQSPELRDFLSALRDHSIWQEVFSGVVRQQLELAVRRTARAMGLEPGELSAHREAFEGRLFETLRIELANFGLTLESLDVMRMVIAEVEADKQGRALETLAAATLRTREQQLALAMRHIRAHGLEETPAMIEMVMMLIGGLQGQVALVHTRPAEAAPKLKEREWAA